MSRLRRSRSEPRRDPDLDSSRLSRLPAASGPEEAYLRLVANPFLLVGSVLLVLSIVPLAAWLILFAFPWLLHYHCLDCGRTGRFIQWRAHVCPIVAERRVLGQPRRVRGLTPGFQLMLLLWAFAIILIAINDWFPRRVA